MDFKNKRVLVVGSGISGIGAVSLLAAKGAQITLYDGNEQQSEEAIRARLDVKVPVRICIGAFPQELYEHIEIAVLSPGVPTDLPFVTKMKARGIRIWGEIELGYQCAAGKIIAITGTNGKTTTTTLVGEICDHYIDDVYVVGNIGKPYTKAAPLMTEETLTVAEISSFQLETVEEFHPQVSAILNITPDHLDRHHTFEEYARVKKLITDNQTEADTCVLNYEDPMLREYGKTLLSQKAMQEKVCPDVLFFSSRRRLEKGIFLEAGTIWYTDGKETDEVCKTEQLRLLGLHNYENIMAAVAMTVAAGIPMDVIRGCVLAFQGVEHRIEYVTEKDGVTYYNDSKGTNPDAAIKGIQAMNRPTYLIAGGYDKKSDYKEWIRSFEGRVKTLVLIGETKEQIAKDAQVCGFKDYRFADTLEEAVQFCMESSQAGEAVLLSPACASWDMFPNYETRGRMFKEYVINA